MTGCLTVCSDYGGLRAWLRLRRRRRLCDWGRDLLPGLGDRPFCHSYGNREQTLPVSSCALHPSRCACLSPSPSWSTLLQRLQMCTNKGGLKQNESKQTNGIRVMGVGGLVHCDKHNDAVYVCVCVSRGLSVVRCVVCVAVRLLLGVFVCLPICLCFCNYMCVYLPGLSTVCFVRCPTKSSPCALYLCVFLRLPPPSLLLWGQSPSCLSLYIGLCLCIEDTCTSLLDSKVLLLGP